VFFRFFCVFIPNLFGGGRIWIGDGKISKHAVFVSAGPRAQRKQILVSSSPSNEVLPSSFSAKLKRVNTVLPVVLFLECVVLVGFFFLVLFTWASFARCSDQRRYVLLAVAYQALLTRITWSVGGPLYFFLIRDGWQGMVLYWCLRPYWSVLGLILGFVAMHLLILGPVWVTWIALVNSRIFWMMVGFKIGFPSNR